MADNTQRPSTHENRRHLNAAHQIMPHNSRAHTNARQRFEIRNANSYMRFVLQRMRVFEIEPSLRPSTTCAVHKGTKALFCYVCSPKNTLTALQCADSNCTRELRAISLDAMRTCGDVVNWRQNATRTLIQGCNRLV